MGEKKKKNKKIDFAKYEIMDRASIIMENFSRFIYDTPAVKNDKGLKHESKRVLNSLMDFYQFAANKYWDTEK